jgi:hypothetical protein
MRVEVEVTQEDIDHGSPCSSGDCPVALALLRALGCAQVCVGVGYFDFRADSGAWLDDDGNGEGGNSIMLPLAAQAFIRGFDHRETRDEVTPFKFTVEIPA